MRKTPSVRKKRIFSAEKLGKQHAECELPAVGRKSENRAVVFGAVRLVLCVDKEELINGDSVEGKK